MGIIQPLLLKVNTFQQAEKNDLILAIQLLPTEKIEEMLHMSFVKLISHKIEQ